MTEKQIRDLLDKALVFMANANMRLYGRSLTPDMSRVFYLAFKHRGLDPRYIEPAAMWFASRAGDYPSAGEFCDRVRALMDEDRPPFRILVSDRDPAPGLEAGTATVDAKEVDSLIERLHSGVSMNGHEMRKNRACHSSQLVL